MDVNDWLDQAGGSPGDASGYAPRGPAPAPRRANPLTVVWVAVLGTIAVVATLGLLGLAALGSCGRAMEEGGKRAAAQERAADAATPTRRPPVRR